MHNAVESPPASAPPTRTNPAVFFLSVHLSSGPSGPAHPVLQSIQFNHIYAGGGLSTHTGGEADEIVVSSEAHVYVYGITCGHAVIENEKCRLSSLKLIRRKAALISTNWPKEQFYLFLSTLFLVDDPWRRGTRIKQSSSAAIRWRSCKLQSECMTGPIRVIRSKRRN